MKKVILFGGSFDPVHDGHLQIAKSALSHLQADELWFILAAQSPFKLEGTSFENRKTMLNFMLKDEAKMRICDIENQLPKPSYSIDTLKALKEKYPKIEFYWLIGSDQIKDLHKWKDFEILNTLVSFVVYKRDGFDEAHSYPLIDGPTMAVSSTMIREATSTQTHPKILEYMMLENLYLDTMLQHRLSPKRYQHTLRVCELALELAKVHQLDVKKMTLIAMFHDFSKEDDPLYLEEIMKEHFSKQAKRHPAFYHAYAARYILSNHYNIKDCVILDAIENHVDGGLEEPYAMILYIADKCEVGRGYDSSNLISLAKEDLLKGFLEVKKSSEDYRRKK